MDLANSQPTARFDEERARNAKRVALKQQNEQSVELGAFPTPSQSALLIVL
jgi:hypothetical protein